MLYDENYFISPGGNAVLLTDVDHTAGVLATAPTPFGIALSRGAVSLLKRHWFGQGEMQPLARSHERDSSCEASRHRAEATEFVRAHHPSLALSRSSKASEIEEVGEVERSSMIELSGLKPVSVGPGRMRRRKVNGSTVILHESFKSLEPGCVPLIDVPLGFDAGIAQLPQDLQLARATLAAGNNCAACAVCAGCVFCAEVNFYVGAVGFLGLVGLAAAAPVGGAARARA